MIQKLASKIRNYLVSPILQSLQSGISSHTPFKPVLYEFQSGVSSIDQKILSLLYKRNHHLTFKDVGFRVHSQHEEDGILLYIFSLIDTTNKRCVEICAGDGIECNTANLIINHGWIGLLCDGNEINIAKAKEYYSSNPDTSYWPPTIIKEWITKDNVNKFIKVNGFAGQVDLLSLDIDGIDYWLWKEISCISPRVVVLEFNHLWGPDVSVSVPYRKDFVAEFTQYGSDYAGASLKAFVKLGKEKDYRLVGTNAIATNAFFVRNDIPCDSLPEIDIATCFEHPRAQFGINYRLPGVKNKEWVEI